MRKASQHGNVGERGFSILELLLVLSAGIVLTAIAIPNITTFLRTYRSVGDARDISGAVSLVKMRAAGSFTRARVYADFSASQFRIQTWTIGSGQTSNCWVTDGDPTGKCSENGSSNPPWSALSKGVSFGFASLTTSPSGAAIAQAPLCQSDAETTAATAGSTANTACIVFNSRAVPVDNTGSASPASLYVTDGSSVYAVIVAATGLIQTWRGGVTSQTWSIR